jgi:hypothetical protein
MIRFTHAARAGLFFTCSPYPAVRFIISHV